MPRLAAAPSTPPPRPETQNVETGWFLDPDGRPTAVTENASSIPVPGPQHDPEHYKFRSTWSMQDGIWKKLEDRVPWAKVSKRDITRDGKPVERLVTSFSPDQTVGHRPSIESTSETQRDVKRDAEQSGLPPGRDQPTMSDAQPSAAAGLPAGESQQAGVLAVFCGECGCADQQHDLEFAQCVRCNSRSFVTDPRQVTNWFDEVEERHALQQLQDFAYVPKTKQWSEFPRAGVQETTLPARDVMDEIYEHESYVLDVGQAFQQLPDGARQDHSCAWSVATEVDDDSDWHWQEVFQDINIALDTLDENLKALPATTKTLFIKHQMKADIKPGCRKVGMAGTSSTLLDGVAHHLSYNLFFNKMTSPRCTTPTSRTLPTRSLQPWTLRSTRMLQTLSTISGLPGKKPLGLQIQDLTASACSSPRPRPSPALSPVRRRTKRMRLPVWAELPNKRSRKRRLGEQFQQTTGPNSSSPTRRSGVNG